MQVRPIEPHEISVFAGTCGAPDNVRAVQGYLEQMLAGGAMRGDWCFLLENGGTPVGRVALWTLPGSGVPLAVVLLDVPWDAGWSSAGGELLRFARERARAVGATHLGYVLDSPRGWPQWQDHPEERVALLEEAGFVLERETRRFEWPGGAVRPASGERLTYRTLAEVGEDAFVEALAAVSTDSLDQRDREERERQGAAGAARELLAELRRLEYEPAWWELAYGAAGELVGLVMPARNPTFATIGYIGVTPAQRGRGYVDALLARGTATLLGAGATAIRADTDRRNAPMANAFARAGWVEFATRREFGVDLGAG
jgi:RimJ/RimL family protein N-acetyltransferase